MYNFSRIFFIINISIKLVLFIYKKDKFTHIVKFSQFIEHIDGIHKDVAPAGASGRVSVFKSYNKRWPYV